MKRAIKLISRIASATATVASVLAFCTVMCTVEMERITLTPFLVLFAAEAWLIYVYMKHERDGEE